MGLLQNEDFKTEAELTGAGGNKNQLLNDTKIYITANGINETLDDAILLGKIGGGGGMSLIWRNDSLYASGEATYFGQYTYEFTARESQVVNTLLKVPSTYTAGTQIKLRIKIFSPTGSGTILMTSTSTLIRSTLDALSSTANQRSSTNSAQSISTANLEYIIELDISSATGQINSTNISANDTILISLTRGSDSNTDLALFQPSSCEVKI